MELAFVLKKRSERPESPQMGMPRGTTNSEDRRQSFANLSQPDQLAASKGERDPDRLCNASLAGLQNSSMS